MPVECLLIVQLLKAKEDRQMTAGNSCLNMHLMVAQAAKHLPVCVTTEQLDFASKKWNHPLRDDLERKPCRER